MPRATTITSPAIPWSRYLVMITSSSDTITRPSKSMTKSPTFNESSKRERLISLSSPSSAASRATSLQRSSWTKKQTRVSSSSSTTKRKSQPTKKSSTKLNRSSLSSVPLKTPSSLNSRLTSTPQANHTTESSVSTSTAKTRARYPRLKLHQAPSMISCGTKREKTFSSSAGSCQPSPSFSTRRIKSSSNSENSTRTKSFGETWEGFSVSEGSEISVEKWKSGI